MAPIQFLLAAALLALDGIHAHPGHSVAEEALERREFMKRQPNSVRSCADNLARRGLTAGAIARRQELAQKAKAKRSLPLDQPLVKRDFATYNVSHASSATFGDINTSLFADNSSCILQSETTQGPYYVDGELIRGDITEAQAGVPLFLDLQLIDTSSCEPVSSVFVDFWQCNATGVYSGVNANGNGNINDTTNLDKTFLRGIQQTDANGVVQIETIVPGHYTGRTNHIHILTHNTNSTIVRTNSTLLQSAGNFSTHASHVGQLFFDQDLVSLVEATAPYNSNTQELTTNSVDSILSQEADTTDPFVHYAQLTDDINDGILAWISVGIDPTSDQTISSAATIYDEFGEANANSGMSGGGPPPGASGSGAPPSSTAA